MAGRPVTTRRTRRSPPAAKRRPSPAGVQGHAALIAAWPGPAAVLAADGSVVSANASAAELVAELAARAGQAGLAQLVSEACADGQARTDTLVIAGRPANLTYDLSVVPAGDGQALLLARDVSLAANLRQALAESRQRFKDLVEISSDFAWETDANGAFAFVSPKGALGWAAADLLGRPAASFIADADSPATAFAARTLVSQVELWLRRSDGTPACVSISALPLVAADGTWRGARGVWRDITELHERDAALAEVQNRERLVGYITRTIRDEVEPEAMLTAAASAAARALGAAGCRIWGREGNEFLPAADFGVEPSKAAAKTIAAHALDLQARDDQRNDAIEIADASGTFLGAVTRFRRQINGAIGLWRAPDDQPWSDSDREIISKIADQIGIAQEQIANHAALAQQARTDALTGLLNRRSFTMRLEEGIAECARKGEPATLVYVDLDNFKAVNDRLGHPAGDAALKGLATCLRKLVRASDFVARLGGDEFAIWLASTNREGAVNRARDILALKNDIASYSAGPDKPLGLSVGLAVYRPDEPETVNELLTRADTAMYEVKRNGKGSYTLAPSVSELRVREAGAGRAAS